MNSHHDRQDGGEHQQPDPHQHPQPDPQPDPQPRPSTSHRFYTWLRELGIQRGDDRWIGGVSSGIAHRIGIDPVIVRGLFILFMIFGGVGVLLYGLAWALLPEPDGRIHLEGAVKGFWSDGMTGALIVTIVGFFRPFGGFRDTSAGVGDALWTLIWVGGLIALGVWLFGRSRDRKRKGKGTTTTTTPSAPTAAAASTMQMPDSPTTPMSTTPADEALATAPASAYTGEATDSYGPAPIYNKDRYEVYDEDRYSADTTGRGYRPPQQKSSGNRGPNAAMVAVSAGCAMLSGGGLLALNHFGVIDLGPHANAIAAASAAAVLGISIVLSGTLGRTSGTNGFLAVVALLAAGVFGLIPTANNFVVGTTTTWDPRSAAVAESGYATAMAEGTLELGQLAEQGPLDEDIVVPVQVAMGSMTVAVPDDVPIEVQSDLAFGSLNFDGDGTASSGIWNPTDQTLNADAPGEKIILQVRGIFSQVTIADAGNGQGQ